MKLGKLTFALGLSAILGFAHAATAEAKDGAYEAANRAAVQMWLNQKAQQGVYFPNPGVAGQALQYEQATGQSLYGNPYYNNYNYYGNSLNFGSYYSPFYGF